MIEGRVNYPHPSSPDEIKKSRRTKNLIKAFWSRIRELLLCDVYIFLRRHFCHDGMKRQRERENLSLCSEDVPVILSKLLDTIPNKN